MSKTHPKHNEHIIAVMIYIGIVWSSVFNRIILNMIWYNKLQNVGLYTMINMTSITYIAAAEACMPPRHPLLC